MSGERIILTLLAQIALILALTRLMGWIFSRLRQPQIVGEIFAGIMLGPSMLGSDSTAVLWPAFSAGNAAVLAVLAGIAAIFLIFLIGLKLDCSGLATLAAWSILAIAILIARHSLTTVTFSAITSWPWQCLIRPLLRRLILIHEQRRQNGPQHAGGHCAPPAPILPRRAVDWASATASATGFALVMPKEPKFVRHLMEKLQDLVLVFLATDFHRLSSASILICAPSTRRDGGESLF